MSRTSTLLQHAVLLACLACIPCLVGCGGGRTLHQGPRALAATDAIGVWSLTDDENATFDVRLTGDGRASSNWSKGPTGAAGETGRWVVDGHRIVVDYTDGWRDVIVSTRDGRFQKESFSPSADRKGLPTNRGQSVRTSAEFAPWVGTYLVGGSAHLAIQSSQAAWRTGSTPAVGCWWMGDGGLWVRWADGSLESLRANASAAGPSHELSGWGSGPSPDATPSWRRPAERLP